MIIELSSKKVYSIVIGDEEITLEADGTWHSMTKFVAPDGEFIIVDALETSNHIKEFLDELIGDPVECRVIKASAGLLLKLEKANS